MNRFFMVIATIIITIASAGAQEFEQYNDTFATADSTLNNIIERYSSWQSAEFSGKLHCDKLPLSPTVKMFMVNDSLLQISVRAPFLGELGRIKITNKEIELVNKFNHVYSRESTENFLNIYPGAIRDLQSLFLARIVVMGSGELNAFNTQFVNVQTDGEDGWIVIPKGIAGLVQLNYGYLVGSNFRTNAFLATIADKFSLQFLYSYPNKGEKIDISLSAQNKNIEATLDFDSVKWGGKEMSAIRLDKYKQVGIKEFFSSISK